MSRVFLLLSNLFSPTQQCGSYREYLSCIFLCYVCDTEEHKNNLKSRGWRQDQRPDQWSTGAFPDDFCLPAAQGNLIAMWSLCNASTRLQQLLDWRLKEESVFCQLCGSSFSIRMRCIPTRSAKCMWQGATICTGEWDDDIIEVCCMKSNLNMVTSARFEGILGTASPLIIADWWSASQANKKHPWKFSDWKQGSSFVVTRETSWNRASLLASKWVFFFFFYWIRT